MSIRTYRGRNGLTLDFDLRDGDAEGVLYWPADADGTRRRVTSMSRESALTALASTDYVLDRLPDMPRTGTRIDFPVRDLRGEHEETGIVIGASNGVGLVVRTEQRGDIVLEGDKWAALVTEAVIA